MAADLSCRQGTAGGDHACTDAAASERAHPQAPPDRTSAKTMLSGNPSLMLARMDGGGDPADQGNLQKQTQDALKRLAHGEKRKPGEHKSNE